jgi:predicted dehydrogenase
MNSYKQQIGVGLIGAGRMGTIRAHLAGSAPQVHFLAIADTHEDKAAELARQTRAAYYSSDMMSVIDHPKVDAVIVSTPEGEHAEAVCQALERGKHVLVEKPIALTLADADRILDVQRRTGVDLFVGYSQRFRRRFLLIKQQIEDGRLGEVQSARLMLYNTRAVAREIYARSKDASPFTDALTHMVDMALWFFAPRRPSHLYALGGGEVFKEHPKGLGDYGWAILTFEDGTAANLGCSWIFPERWPANVANIGMEIFGTEGAISVDDSHSDVIFAGDGEIASPYATDSSVEVSFLGSPMPGDWALDDFYGPMREETRQFLERVTSGRKVILCDGSTGRDILELTLAMEKSAEQAGVVVSLPLGLERRAA